MKMTYDLFQSVPYYNIINVHVPEDYSSTISDFIKNFQNKFKWRVQANITYILCRNEFIPDNDLRLFAIWCALRVKNLIKDKRSINLINVAERYANGLVTKEELTVARDCARTASWNIKGKLAMAVARINAKDAANESAIYASEIAAWNAAKVFSNSKNDYNKDVDIAYDNSILIERNTILDKLLEYFIAKENNQEFDWNK